MGTQTTSSGQPNAVGVQELIDRLKTDGVSRGQQEADALLAETRKHSMKILDDAKREAEQILAQARTEARDTAENGQQALKLASRDAALRLKESFQHEFKQRFGKLVSQTMHEPEFLKRMILEVAGRSTSTSRGDTMQILVPAEQATADQASESNQFVLGLTAEMLLEGVTFGSIGDSSQGIRVKLADSDVEVDLSDVAVSNLLMRFLTPRFRSLIESGQ